MILTPLDRGTLPDKLAAFGYAVAGHLLARAVFERIGATWTADGAFELSTDAQHHAQALDLCKSFGFGTIDIDPHDYFTWDGQAVATRVEASLLVHEIGHYQSAAPARRTIIDFALGGGPETGRKAEANAVRAVSDLQADIEEGMASLLGILWEAELGQSAVPAFLEQNWLENETSDHNIRHFLKMTTFLASHGLIDAAGRPTRNLRQEDDSQFVAGWQRLG
ncbi:MAG TPA: hypothetical protein VGG27_01170 [Magnetospirillaceae bacterium]|jgi:hypothetical protein